MNKNKLNILSLFLLLIGVVSFTACQEEDMVFEKTRLFRPVLNEALFSEDNTIIVNMGKMKEAVSYTLEVSRDTFNTIEYVIETDTSYVEINEELIGEELFWNTVYQVRATAHAASAEYDSKVSDLGNVRTQRFPTILNSPASYDVIDVAARVTWVKAGAPVTGVKVFAPDDLQLKNPLMDELPVSSEEHDAGEVIVTGLEPETEYQIAIYSGGELRGWVSYTTRETLPSGGNVIDLTESSDPMILAQTLQTAPEGSVLILKRGMVYDMSQPPVLERSVEVRGGYNFNPERATIEMGTHKGFNIADTGVGSVVFNDVAVRGPYEGSFLFYLNSNGTLGEVRYENCKIGPLRGGLRVNSGEGTIEKIAFNNVEVDSLNDFNFIFMQGSGWKVGDIHISNSTFAKVGSSFIRNSNGNEMQSILVESSTFYEVTEKGRYILDWGGKDGVIPNGIVFRSNIWGRGWNKAEEEDFGIKGANGLGNVSFTLENNWGTGDLEIYSNEIPGFPNFTYSKDSHDLWVDPDNLDFNFKDSGFGGRRDTGDPRWRDEL